MNRLLLKYLVLLQLVCMQSFAQWIPFNTGTTSRLTRVFFADANTGFIIGLSGTTRKTTNAGINWSAVTNFTANHLYGVFFNNTNTGYVCGDGVFFKTIDGGVSWTPQSVPAELYRNIFFINDLIGYSCAINGLIIRTTNAGANWSALNTGTTQFLQNVRFADALTGYACGSSGTLIKTTNGGENWITLTSGTTLPLFALALVSPTVAYVGGDAGILKKTTDGGANWITQNSNAANRIVNFHFLNANTGSGSGQGNIIIRTTNAGAEWIMQNSGITGEDFEGVYFTSVQTGYLAVSDGRVLKTTTGGFPVPSAPNLLSPLNGAVNVSLTALLDWDTATAAKTYQVQIETDSNFVTPVLDSSGIVNSQMNIPAGTLSNNTLYYWRVRSDNAGGSGPWSVIFRFRTIVALPLAPGLLLPVNGASNVSLTPLFDWDSNSTATFYRLQAALDTSFTNPPVDITNITQSFLNLVSPPLQNNFRYYWRVNATNPAGTGPWSAVFNFTTVLGLPAAPAHLSPPNNSTGISLTPVLDWVDDISATSYRIQLSEDSTFTSQSIMDSTGFSISSITVPAGLLTNVRNYFWRVRTTNPIGTGPYSVPWKFTTLLAPPVQPILVSPPNNSTDISTTPTLDWDSVPYAASYRIQISTDPGFVTTITNISGLTASQYNVPGGVLENNTLYYWRVNATNAAGTSPFSAVWNFRTIISPPVAAPNLISPPNGATNQSATPTLDWNDVFGTNGYRLQVSNDSLFNNIPVLDTTITPSQFTIPAGILIGNTYYYWRVRGFNVGGFGPWSVTWRFRTGPIGISPLGNEIPAEFKLYSNYPNPFNPVTTIKFDIPVSDRVMLSEVKLTVFDVTGKVIAIIVNERLNPGKYEIAWDASQFASGIYFYRLTAGEHTGIRKMILLK